MYLCTMGVGEWINKNLIYKILNISRSKQNDNHTLIVLFFLCTLESLYYVWPVEGFSFLTLPGAVLGGVDGVGGGCFEGGFEVLLWSCDVL